MWDILSDLPHGTNKICLDAAVASSEMQDLGYRRNVQTWNSMWMFKLGLNNVSPWAETQVAFVAARLIHGLFREIPHLPHRFAPKAVVPSSKWSEAKGCKRQCLAVHQLGSLKRRAERVSYPGVDRYWNYKVPTRSALPKLLEFGEVGNLAALTKCWGKIACLCAMNYFPSLLKQVISCHF